MLPSGELTIRHPRQWMLDALFVWSILTLVSSLLRIVMIGISTWP
jgi:hypothetical protein